MMLKNPIPTGSNVDRVRQVGMVEHPGECRKHGWCVALFILGCERRDEANFHKGNPRSDMAICNLRSGTAHIERSTHPPCNNFLHIEKIPTGATRVPHVPLVATAGVAQGGNE